jgi:hypothetical protein
MIPMIASKFQLVPAHWIKIAALAASLAFVAPTGAAGATPDDAKDILKKMTDYIAAQKNVSAKYDSDIEVVTTQGQKISFASSGKILIQRPDKLRASRTGGYSDVDMVFDGKTLSILGKNLNSYTQIDAPGSLGKLVETIRDRTDVALPAADLFSSTAYADLTSDLTSAQHIGRGVVGGVECEHLAFRTADVDWQLWVQLGPNPIPRKYVITSKQVTGAPQYTVEFDDWQTDVPVAADSFTFTPPAGASKVAASDLRKENEVPGGVVIAARK